MVVDEDMKNFKAFNTIRQVFQSMVRQCFLEYNSWISYFFQARAYKRLYGIRAKKAAEAEADDLAKKK